MTITFYFKETKKGFIAGSDFMDISIHKGIRAWAKSKDEAIERLVIKWNKKVNEDYKHLFENKAEGIIVEKINLVFNK